MMYKLLTLDLDGTTLDSKKNFPAETVDAIKKLRQHGIETALASGRALPELDEYQDAVKSMLFGIMTSGAIIYDFQHDKAHGNHQKVARSRFDGADYHDKKFSSTAVENRSNGRVQYAGISADVSANLLSLR